MRLKALDKAAMSGTAQTTLVIVLVAAIVFMPFAVIWALNTLFSLSIAYGGYEWMAVLVLSAFLQTRVSNK